MSPIELIKELKEMIRGQATQQFPDFKKFSLLEQTETVTSDSTTMTPTEQEGLKPDLQEHINESI